MANSTHQESISILNRADSFPDEVSVTAWFMLQHIREACKRVDMSFAYLVRSTRSIEAGAEEHGQHQV